MDKANLSNYIEQVTLEHCTNSTLNTVQSTCIEENATEIVSNMDQYIRNHLLRIISIIVQEDLPPLFETTQSHVNSILAHFSKYLNKQQSITSTTSSTIVMYHSFENSEQLTSSLQSTIDFYHSSLENSTLEKYLLLARVD